MPDDYRALYVSSTLAVLAASVYCGIKGTNDANLADWVSILLLLAALPLIVGLVWSRFLSTTSRQDRSIDPSRYLAMDCEMVGVGECSLLAEESALARVTLVDWQGQVVVDTLVRPYERITDYRTRVSGVRRQDLIDAEDLEHCRARMGQLILDKIVVGHGLDNDWQALGMVHPWWLCRDTAKYKPFMKKLRGGRLGPRRLRDLAKEILNREIQRPNRPHDAIEDALAALDLYKTVREDFEAALARKIKQSRLPNR